MKLGGVLSACLHDVRFGLRMLVKSPMISLAAILCLGIGIGANTTIFSMVNSILIRPIPIDESHRLYRVNGRIPSRSGTLSLSLPNYVDLRERGRDVFEEMGIFDNDSFNLGRGERAERVQGAYFSSTMFDVLRVRPCIGRPFTRADDRKGAEPVVILSHSLWRRKYRSDPGIVGSPIAFDGRTARVLGVMPAGFEFPLYSDVFVPFQLDYANQPRGSSWTQGLARLRHGVSIERAGAEIETISAALAKEYDLDRGRWRATLTPLLEYYLPGTLKVMLVLFPIAVFLVLVIACVNVANLLLAKGLERQREVAIRASLGATRARILRQLLTEALLIAGIGAAAGILLSLWGIDLMLSAVQIPIPYWIKLDIDATVLGYTLAIGFAAGLIAGIVPALQASRTDLTSNLKDAGSSTTASRHRHFVRNCLMVVQVTAAVTLLILSGVMIQDLLRQQKIDPGFDPNNLLTARVELPASKYGTTAKVRDFTHRSIEELRQLPGVDDGCVCDRLPLSGSSSDITFTVEGAPPLGPNEPWPWARCKYVSAGYFKVMRIPLLAGRAFDERDAVKPEAERVAIINQTMADRYFEGDAVGKRFHLGSSSGTLTQIIGVARNVKYAHLDEKPWSVMYLSSSQTTRRRLCFAIRTDNDPMAHAAAMRSRIQRLDPDLPVEKIMPMKQVVRISLWTSEFFAQVLGTLGVVALVLAAFGLYGVIAFGVSRRTHEIGIRMALGARARDVMRLVMRQGIALSVIGIVIGVAISLAGTIALTSLVPEVRADASTFVIVPVVILAVVVLASFLPARRATRIEPMSALRFE